MKETQKVILVNEWDEAIGEAEKMEAHEKALLHRAFSVFIFNENGELLLQQRAMNKYHSPGLWTNSCCSHPSPGEDTLSAASRRLSEELGFSTSLRKAFDFIYKAEFDNGLTEYEFDHVYVGEYSGTVLFNPDEVKQISYQSMEEIGKSMDLHPDRYTKWFQLIFRRVEKWWAERDKNTLLK